MSQSANQFKALQWRLLLSSVGVIGLTLVVFGITVYQFVAYSLFRKLDRDLFVLADAATHSLPANLQNQKVVAPETTQNLDNDGDLDLPWQNLRQDQQSIEWFNAKGHLLGKAGRSLPEYSLVPKFQPKFQSWQQGHLRSLTMPVYATVSDQLKQDRLEQPASRQKLKQIKGYIRVSTVTDSTNGELERLRSGLGWSGLVALAFCGIGSWWLMRQSLQPIEQSFQQLKQFTADASHELRNPIAGIKTSIEVLQSHPERIHPADVKKIAAIASATEEMTRLIEDLLLLARTDGSISSSIAWTVIPIDELLEDLVDLYLPQAEAKQLTFKYSLLSQSYVKGEAMQLKRLFSNLLVNAMQYTSAGGTISLIAQSENDWTVIRIEDTGIGIASEQISLIFNRFWRADQARSRRECGTGLGLALAQTIAHAHRGRITVKSQPGIGSCFQVELPIIAQI